MAGPTLKLNIKVVGGQGCIIEVRNDTSVAEVKGIVGSILNIPVSQQKLLHKGKPLTDGKKLLEYNIENGAMLHLIKNKDSGSSKSISQTNIILHVEMKKFLRRYFSEAEADKVADEYMKEFNRSLRQYSLDDWQRVATRYLQGGGEGV